MLPDRCQKRKCNVTSCCWKAKLATLHTEKNYLLVTFSIFRGPEGDRATSPSSTSRNGLIDASRLSLEAQMERDFMQLEGEVGHFAQEKKYQLALFTFARGSEGDRATSPSSASRNRSIDASRLSLEAQMQRDFMQLEGEVGHFAHGKKLPDFAFYLCSWLRGRRGNVALFCS